MKNFNFIAGNRFELDDFKSIESFVDTYSDFQTVTLNDTDELWLLLQLIGIDNVNAQEFTDSEFSLYWDLSEFRLPELNEEQFDKFYKDWIEKSHRDNNMDEYGDLIFLQRKSKLWNSLKYRLIVLENFQISDNLKIFRNEYLNANTWSQRKDGVPFDLLDNLSKEELKVAEKELIDSISLKDDWPIKGLGYLKSKDSLPKLYEILPKGKKGLKVTIAHSIFQICGDKEMINIVLSEMPKISNQYELIDVLYLLKGFGDDKINQLLAGFREHNEYLVAYNATQAMGLSTDEIVTKFRNKHSRNFWGRLKKIWR